MARGYMGKILNVDLSKGTIQEEALDEALCRDYIGGYGIGAKLLYERMPAGADPHLDPHTQPYTINLHSEHIQPSTQQRRET